MKEGDGNGGENGKDDSFNRRDAQGEFGGWFVHATHLCI